MTEYTLDNFNRLDIPIVRRPKGNPPLAYMIKLAIDWERPGALDSRALIKHRITRRKPSQTDDPAIVANAGFPDPDLTYRPP
jgi:hypothetical protein